MSVWRFNLSLKKLFKNSIDTQEMLGLNIHSINVSDLLEYRRKD
jgi:hypothetical protein